MHHVWHEDRGFRKCTILNRGIEAARGDYLISSDGDCVPPLDARFGHAVLVDGRPAARACPARTAVMVSSMRACTGNDERGQRVG